MDVTTSGDNWPWDLCHSDWAKTMFKSGTAKQIKHQAAMKTNQLPMLKTVSEHTNAWRGLAESGSKIVWVIHPDYKEWIIKLNEKFDDEDAPDVKCGHHNGYVEYWHMHEGLQQRVFCANAR